jgi:hypothetical protein
MQKCFYNSVLLIFLLLSFIFLSGCVGRKDDSTSGSSADLIPAAPTEFTLRAISSSAIALSWNDNSTTEIGFYVEHRNPQATFTRLSTLPANTTSYTHTGLTAYSTHYYRLQAWNYVGLSNYSDVVSTSTLAPGMTLDNWFLITTTPAPSARIGHTAVQVDGIGMIVYGGDFLQDGAVYSPTINTWIQQITTTNSPSARVGHTAIWTGTEMLVWGGELLVPIAIEWSDPPTNSIPSLYRVTTMEGARYNPISNTWKAIATTIYTPEDRVNHTAIWTGNRMIIWGGERVRMSVTGSMTRTKLNTGGVYDPDSDSWGYFPNLNSGFGAPSARRYHSCVWTGGQMLVWAGDGGSNTGGMYSPTTDLWILEPIATLKAPSARYAHSTIWTGDGSKSWRNKMIVWGGTNGESYFNNGGIYDPVSNTWTALPTTGAPISRVYHSVVWTGTKMIVWGGGAGVVQGAFNDGGIYNPARNIWEPLTTTDAPTARTYHTAVWDNINKTMLIWGGWDALNTFADGGAYTTD